MTAEDATDRRLAELEIKASYADDQLDQLNLTVYRQQEQINRLIARLAQLQQQVPEAGGSGRDERPPHY